MKNAMKTLRIRKTILLHREKIFRKDLFENVTIQADQQEKFQILPNTIVFAPDKVCDTYVDMSDDLHLLKVLRY